MKLRPYPKYKDSGVEQLGEIPEEWEIKRLKYVCSKYAEYGLNIAAENYQIDGIRFIRTTDIDDYGNLKDEGVYLNESLAKGYILNSGDLLISRSGTIGRSFLYDSSKNEKATYAGYLVRYSLDEKETFPKYIFYFIQGHSFFEWLKTQLIETTISNVNGQKYSNLSVTLPSLDKQIQITNYLDQKTSKIDELTKKNERLIELLKERRQAIIFQAVTKGLPAAAAAQAGLDPNVKMKDSGIEWLGKIPEGWDLKRLKYVCSKYAEYGLNIAAENYQIDGIRFIRTTDIDDYGNLKEEGVYLDELLSKHYVLNDGDILISRSGTIGRTFLFDSKKNEKATYAGYLVRFCLDRKETVPKYIFYFAQSHSFFEWLKTQLIETTIGNVNGQKYANLLVTLPQKEHQTQIANYLDQKTSKIDGLIKKIESQIENLKEHRQTLISNIVTGKVSVSDTA